jgi:hypothetical protein
MPLPKSSPSNGLRGANKQHLGISPNRSAFEGRQDARYENIPRILDSRERSNQEGIQGPATSS